MAILEVNRHGFRTFWKLIFFFFGKKLIFALFLHFMAQNAIITILSVKYGLTLIAIGFKADWSEENLKI